MILRKLLTLAAALALSACQVTVVPPSAPATPPYRPTVAELRNVCVRQAEAQQLRVLRIGTFETVTGSRGVEVGATAVMQVTRNGRTAEVRCSYNFYDRQARITALDGAPASGPRPTPAQLRSACVRQAQSQGLSVIQVGQFETVTGSRGVEIGATSVMVVARGGNIQPLRCNYSFGDGRVRLTEV